MLSLITDEMIETIAIVGNPTTVVDKMKMRLGGIIHRTGFSDASLSDTTLGDMLERLRG